MTRGTQGWVTISVAEGRVAGTGGRVLRWAGPTAVALLTSVVGLHRLGEKSFWIDEGSTGLAVLSPWSSLWVTATQHEPNLGLYYSLLKVWSVLGTSEFVLRLFSVLCMAATAPLVYLIGRRLFSFRAGLIGGVLFGVNTFVLRYAQEARPYALGVLTVTLASFLFLVALEKESTRWWSAYVMSAFVATFADPWGVTVIVAHIFAMFFQPRRPQWKMIAIAGLVAAAILGPFIFRLMTTDVGRVKWIPPTTWHGFIGTLENLAGGTRLLLWLYMAASLLALAAIVRSRRLNWPILYASLLFVMPVVLILAASMVKPVFITRYTIVALPGFVVLVAAGLDRLRFASVVTLATAVFVVVAVLGLGRWYDDSQVKTDWRAAVALVTEHKVPGDVVLIHRQGRGAFLYYENSLRVAWLNNALSKMSEVVQLDRIWLVLYPPPADALAVDFQDALAQTHRLAGKRLVDGITLFLYVKRS